MTYRLDAEGGTTRLTLAQDNTPEGSEDEFRANWQTVLGGLKELVERG